MNLQSDWVSAVFDSERQDSFHSLANSTAWSHQVESTAVRELLRPINCVILGVRSTQYHLEALGGIPAANVEHRGESSSTTACEEREKGAYHQLTRNKINSYKERIETLREYGFEDNIMLNELSEMDFWWFVLVSDSRIRVDNLVLMENGNLRAVWRDTDGTHLGLQFLGQGLVQYVIFKKRHKLQPTARVTGRDSLEGFTNQIVAFDLRALISE